MIYPDVTVEEWCSKHLSLKLALPAHCDCGQAAELKPFITKAVLGLSATPCRCGDPHPFSACLLRDSDLKDSLLSALLSL